MKGMQRRILESVRHPFSYSEPPLRRTMDHQGDPGICGPNSATWPIIGDASAFVGGIRSLLIQTAHPEVVAGISDHSAYLSDPLGRLSRTASYVTNTSFGSMQELGEAIAHVRTAHRPVSGTSHRGNAYSAGRPEHAAWVHNALTDSFVAAYHAFGPAPLFPAEADRFVREQAKIGALLDAAPMPRTAATLSDWIATHPDLAPSPGMREVVAFLLDPPLPAKQKLGYRILLRAAIATIPSRILGILEVETKRLDRSIGKTGVRTLRWAIGNSPSWKMALVRSGVEIPEGMFKQDSS